MKAFLNVELERILGYSIAKLRTIIDIASHGKKWRSGASGCVVLANKLGVKVRDLEYFVDSCWNAVAYRTSVAESDSAGKRICRRITRNLLKEVGVGSPERASVIFRWAENVEPSERYETA